MHVNESTPLTRRNPRPGRVQPVKQARPTKERAEKRPDTSRKPRYGAGY